MIRYLLDTDAVIDYFKGFPSTVELIQHLFRQGATLCTCAVVMAGCTRDSSRLSEGAGSTCSSHCVFSQLHLKPPGKLGCGVTNSPAYDTFGKFPATVPSIYVRVCAQAQHIDLDYYDAFHGPEAYLGTHRQHLARWHA